MKSKNEIERSVRLRFRNPRYDRVIRVNTEAIARKMGFNEEQIFDISLAVEEAYANAIEHSHVQITDLELEIQYRLFPDRLEIFIQDSGCGFDRERVNQRPDADCIMADRGRGLGLIRNLSDRAEILSAPGAGTLIMIVKFLSPLATIATVSTVPATAEAELQADKTTHISELVQPPKKPKTTPRKTRARPAEKYQTPWQAPDHATTTAGTRRQPQLVQETKASVAPVTRVRNNDSRGSKGSDIGNSKETTTASRRRARLTEIS